MRFRLLSRPPLGPFKAWFAIPDGQALSQDELPIETIRHLKNTLRNSIPILREGCPHEANLGLSIDGFDLLDGSSLEVIKEGDLITLHFIPLSSTRTASPIQLSPLLSPHHRPNHRASSSRAPRAAPSSAEVVASGTNKRKRQATPSSTSSSSSSSSSSESSSESESSDSESSSESSSSASSSSAPSVYRTRHAVPPPPSTRAVQAIATPKSAPPQVAPVPPGHGKTSTQSRNKRRRQLRAVRRELENQSSTANNGDLNGPSTSTARVPQPQQKQNELRIPTPPPPSYSLKNKNKKRGFRNAMESVVPTRVSFQDGGSTSTSNVIGANANAASGMVVEDEGGEDDEDGPAIGMTMLDGPSPSSIPIADPAVHRTAPQASLDSSEDKATRKQKKKHSSNPTAELIPPSRQKNLPSNIFVTSIDVESDLWGQPSTFGAEKAEEEPLNFTMLENSASAGAGPSTTEGEGNSEIDWDGLDESWGSLATIDASRLTAGSLLAWQEIGLDLATFSPKLMVILGRVTNAPLNYSDGPLDASAKIGITRLVRPNPHADEAMEVEGEDLELMFDATVEELKQWRLYRSA